MIIPTVGRHELKYVLSKLLMAVLVNAIKSCSQSLPNMVCISSGLETPLLGLYPQEIMKKQLTVGMSFIVYNSERATEREKISFKSNDISPLNCQPCTIEYSATAQTDDVAEVDKLLNGKSRL